MSFNKPLAIEVKSLKSKAKLALSENGSRETRFTIFRRLRALLTGSRLPSGSFPSELWVAPDPAL